jgi:riboflavin synthase
MFTGLIEEIGTIRAIRRQGEAMVLTVAAKKVLDGVQLGDSIAVNGVCLTVVSFDSNSFSADVMPETFRRTNLIELKPGSPVNLERAMMAGGRFGGHIVQGHVDGMGVIRSRMTDGNSVVFTIAPESPDLLRTMVPKGSVTLDGISLTVVNVDRSSGVFSVSVIPHTLKETVLQFKQPGDTLNIENDILGKYVDHLLEARQKETERPGGLTVEKLRDNGFLV